LFGTINFILKNNCHVLVPVVALVACLVTSEFGYLSCLFPSLFRRYVGTGLLSPGVLRTEK